MPRVFRQNLDHLRNFVNNYPNPKKQANYAELARGYRKWARRHDIQWFKPRTETWSHGGLDVRVNPELGLRLDGQPHLIKLYFKADGLSANRVALIVQLMHLAYAGHAHANCTMSVLAMRDARLHAPAVPVNGLTAQIGAEVAYWMALWPHV